MKTRAGRTLRAIMVLVLATSPLGCGGAGLQPVTGSVTYQGKPATGAAVHFHREGATAEEAANFPIGLVDAEGNFTLETPGVGSGAMPGKYKVLVRWGLEKDPNAPADKRSSRNSAKGRKDPGSDADRLKYRYFHLDKPLLTAEVKPDSNRLEPFELKD